MFDGKYIKTDIEEKLEKRSDYKMSSNHPDSNPYVHVYEKEVSLELVSEDTTRSGMVILESEKGNEAERQINDRTSEHNGEEEVDIGLKDLPLTGAPNIYVGKRNFIHQLMDVALLMANVSQLKALLSIDSGDKYYYPLLVFIILSISLQVFFTVTMLLIWSIEKGLEERTKKAQEPGLRTSIVVETELSEIDEKKKTLADRLDKLGNILVLSIIVSNVFITGFGVEPHDSGNSSETNG